MLILEQSQDGMALVRRRPTKPSVIAGALFAGLGSIPLVSGVELSGPRLITTFGLYTVAAGLIFLGRPSALRQPLPPEFAKDRLPAAARIELGGLETYEARLVRSDASSVLLFERDEPAGVVRDVLALANRFSLPVRPAWGLDERAWTTLAEGPAGHGSRLGPAVVTEGWPLQRQRTAAFTTLWGGMFIFVVSILMALSPYRSGIAPSALAVLLPLLTVVYVLVVGAWLAGLRERLTLRSSGVELVRQWFGRVLGRPRVVQTPVFAVFAVTPKQSSLHHVLLATGQGPLAFGIDPRVAEKVTLADAELGHAAGRAAE